MGRGIIDVPVRDVAEFVKDVQNNMSWDNFLIVSTLISILLAVLCTMLRIDISQTSYCLFSHSVN